MDAVLDPEAIPALEGAVSFFGRGITSSLHTDNIAALSALGTGHTSPADPLAALLIDPQTAGGLLAGVPADRATECVVELRGLGYRAAEIGFVTHVAGGEPRVQLERGATQALPEPAVAS
jgi:selenide,water dikinase